MSAERETTRLPTGIDLDIHLSRISRPYEPVVVDWWQGAQWLNSENNPQSLVVDDVFYGRFQFDPGNSGDAALIDLMRNERFRRLWYIEQLTLPAEFATKPETIGFTRYEHSLGTLLLTRRLGGTALQQLRAGVHDLSQTAFSHLGDWLKQGFGGSEDHHDNILLGYMRYWGLGEMFEHHGIDIEQLADKDVVDFVERPGPDLCVDRVDYALREFARWTCPDDVPRLVEELEVRDDKVVFRSKEAAKIFGSNYIRLFTHHWAEPEHAYREKLFLTAVQYALATGILADRDLYDVDMMALTKMELAYDHVIGEIFWNLRKDHLEFRDYEGTDTALPVENLAAEPDWLYMPMRKFKLRWVDPEFISEDGTLVRCSEADEDFRDHLRFLFEYHNDSWNEEFARKHGKKWVHFVGIRVDPEIKTLLKGALPELI